ncbi:MAG: hypothetical protein QXW47_03620 [Candidatus Jordarchaeales archaeon]|nr:hypothetical protein [Candidatus Jordarchaeia archaeon]
MVLLVEKDSGDIVASSKDETANVVLLHVLMRLREFSGEGDVVVKLESGRLLKLVEGKNHVALLEIRDS